MAARCLGADDLRIMQNMEFEATEKWAADSGVRVFVRDAIRRAHDYIGEMVSNCLQRQFAALPTSRNRKAAAFAGDDDMVVDLRPMSDLLQELDELVAMLREISWAPMGPIVQWGGSDRLVNILERRAQAQRWIAAFAARRDVADFFAGLRRLGPMSTTADVPQAPPVLWPFISFDDLSATTASVMRLGSGL
jgi:hypothetical protein